MSWQKSEGEVGVSMGGTGGGEKDRRTEGGQEIRDRVPVLARKYVITCLRVTSPLSTSL